MLRESGELLLPSISCIMYTTVNKYYPCEPVNINIQSLMSIIQENNWVITTKKG